MKPSQKILARLQQRREENSLRTLTCKSGLIDFCSNDYLGLAFKKSLFIQIQEEYHRLCDLPINGSTGSRLISGHHVYFEKLESFLAEFFRSDKALLFNSGYAANTGVFSSFPQKGDTILYDELSHACIKDGARLSLANRYSFAHNDVSDLERRLKNATGDTYVAIESIYSMDGDIAPMEDIVAVCEQYGAFLIVDEAHSTGILGDYGEGLTCALQLENRVFLRVHTFGKAVGSHGACVSGNEDAIRFLINFSRPFIYTTSLPLHNLVSIFKSLHYLKTHKDLRDQLFLNIGLLNGLLNGLSGYSGAKTPIHAVHCPGNHTVKQLASALAENGMDVRPILSPTVKEGTERLRICIHATNTPEEMNMLSRLLHEKA